MYERGQIYAIIDEEGMEVYIGSSCNELYKRWHKHKNDAKRNPNTPIYKYIIENGGFEKFRIVLVEDYPCSCKKELVRREGELIKAINPVGNRRIAGRTKTEWYEDNKELILERQREWRIQNKDKMLESMRKYKEQNREKIREYQREWQRKNYRNKKNEL